MSHPHAGPTLAPTADPATAPHFEASRLGCPESCDPQPHRWVGRSVAHDSALAHATGAAVYIADMPPARHQLHVGWLGNPVAHGVITHIDLAAAARLPGVVALLTAADVPGRTRWPP